MLPAQEIERLDREHGVEVFSFADKNSSAGRKAWKAFFQGVDCREGSVTLVGSTLADDIMRDPDVLDFYKQSGLERVLLGMEIPMGQR